MDRGRSSGGDGVPPEQNSGCRPSGGCPRCQPRPAYGRQFCGGNGFAARMVHGAVFSAGGGHGRVIPAGARGVFLDAECLAPAGRLCGGLAGGPALPQRTGGGYLLLCGDAGRGHCERICAGPGRGFAAVGPGILWNAHALLAGFGRRAFHSLAGSWLWRGRYGGVPGCCAGDHGGERRGIGCDFV